MLARTYRFHGHGSLRYVYNNGKLVRSSFGVLKYAPNPRRGNWRAAVVVSKKVHKSAVVRNRIRRRVYEIFRTNISADAEPTDFVYTVYSAQVADMDTKELTQAILGQLQKTGIKLQPHAIVDKKE